MDQNTKEMTNTEEKTARLDKYKSANMPMCTSNLTSLRIGETKRKSEEKYLGPWLRKPHTSIEDP